jgi:diguanylate cyclase (GGDEF)-like protein
MIKINLNISLLIAIIATLIAIPGHWLIPEKRFMATPNPAGANYLHSTTFSDGTPAGVWLDQAKRQFRCVYPETRMANYYCSFNQVQTPSQVKGMDFSRYQRVEVEISYTGPTPKLRMFMRNFDERYSTVEDGNSSKYNVIVIPQQNLNRETSIELSQFKAAEWWLTQYNLPVEESHADVNNVLNLGIEFSDSMEPGNHEVTVERIEFVGHWISKENWYLTILVCWLIGMAIYMAIRLRRLRKKSHRDHFVINRLSQRNASLKSETEKFRRLSTVDPLTQTYNRFGIDQIIESITTITHDDGVPLDYTLILLDLDHFKKINDTRGHDAGDRVLKKVAEVIEQNIRDHDYPGRWGGEEFVIVMPGTNRKGALEIAERIRKAIATTEFEPEDPLHVTASFGISEQRDNEEFAVTLKRVDKALYDAKQQGRNRCVVAE